MKTMPTRLRNVEVTIDYGNYSYNGDFQNCWFVEVGNKMLSGYAKFTTKPTKKQLRIMKNSWIDCMRKWDFKLLSVSLGQCFILE
jgi:hypothetical protein